jgi:hypothetical protein
MSRAWMVRAWGDGEVRLLVVGVAIRFALAVASLLFVWAVGRAFWRVGQSHAGAPFVSSLATLSAVGFVSQCCALVFWALLVTLLVAMVVVFAWRDFERRVWRLLRRLRRVGSV